jgi:hypothetical protein
MLKCVDDSRSTRKGECRLHISNGLWMLKCVDDSRSTQKGECRLHISNSRMRMLVKSSEVKCMDATPSKVECVNSPGKCDNTVSMRIWRALRAVTRARESRLMASPRRACTVVAGYQKLGPWFEWLGTLWTMHLCVLTLLHFLVRFQHGGTVCDFVAKFKQERGETWDDSMPRISVSPHSVSWIEPQSGR